MIDQFTKWVEIHAIPEQTAEQTARIAVNQFLHVFWGSITDLYRPGKKFRWSGYESLVKFVSRS